MRTGGGGNRHVAGMNVPILRSQAGLHTLTGQSIDTDIAAHPVRVYTDRAVAGHFVRVYVDQDVRVYRH